jgi:glycolate oxidase
MTTQDCFLRELIERLSAVVGAKHTLFTAEDIVPYSFDGTAALRQRPACVVFPQNTLQVAECLRITYRAKVPTVVRGSGTGLSGGSVPVEGCVVLCTIDLNQIIEIDVRNLTIRAQPGVVTQEIDKLAAQYGLFYPPDPGSQKICTIGGNVAENSGGLRGLKYGVTRDYVMGLEVVLADGEVLWLGNKCVKDVAGYNLRDLFIGSEGTLGIVTQVLLKLLPRPRFRKTVLASFSSMVAAAETVSKIIEARIVPCTLEFLDQQTIRCVEDFSQIGLPNDAAALLLMESDGEDLTVEHEIDTMVAIAKEHHAIQVEAAADEAEADRLRLARRSAFSALARVRPTTILEDVTVPRSELKTMISFIAATAEKYRLQIGTFGHMGDGNLHPTFLTDERDVEEMHRVELALEDIVNRTLELGGTITGEHGVGLAKKPFLKRQLGDASYALLKKIKHTLDPEGLLNPGKIF